MFPILNHFTDSALRDSQWSKTGKCQLSGWSWPLSPLKGNSTSLICLFMSHFRFLVDILLMKRSVSTFLWPAFFLYPIGDFWHFPKIMFFSPDFGQYHESWCKCLVQKQNIWRIPLFLRLAKSWIRLLIPLSDSQETDSLGKHKDWRLGIG